MILLSYLIFLFISGAFLGLGHPWIALVALITPVLLHAAHREEV